MRADLCVQSFDLHNLSYFQELGQIFIFDIDLAAVHEVQ